MKLKREGRIVCAADQMDLAASGTLLNSIVYSSFNAMGVEKEEDEESSR